MKLYTGKPANRLHLILPYWHRARSGEPYRKVVSPRAHAEITRIYGATIFGWFFGMQRFVHRDHLNSDMAHTGPDTVEPRT